MINLRGRSFIKLLDFTPEEINYLLKLSHDLKTEFYSGNLRPLHQGKSIALIFEKDSTRTRCSFEVAAASLGIHPVYLGSSGSQFGKKESVIDSAKVLGRLFDGIQFRGFKQSDVEALAQYSGVPVWNGLTDDFHPTQILADFMTIQEKFGPDLKGKKLVFVGDSRNNMGHSLMVGCAKMGMHFVALAPKSLWPSEDLVSKCKEIAKDTGAIIEFHEDKQAGVKDADVIYTDVWVSMGETDWTGRIELLQNYQVDMELIKMAKPTVVFMHCLPAFHDNKTDVSAQKSKEYGAKYPKLKNGEFEVTDEVFQSKHCIAFDEAENRLYTIKAVILATLGV